MHKTINTRQELINEILLFTCESEWTEHRVFLERGSDEYLKSHLLWDLTEDTIYSYTFGRDI